MPFKKINIQEAIENKLQESPEFNKAWHDSRQEYKLLGDLIEMRKAKGLSQADIAALTGNKQQVISRIENRESSPTLRTICRLAEALDCEIKLVSRKET